MEENFKYLEPIIIAQSVSEYPNFHAIYALN